MKLGSVLLQDVLGMMWLGMGCWELVIQMVTLEILGSRGVNYREKEDLRIGKRQLKIKKRGNGK